MKGGNALAPSFFVLISILEALGIGVAIAQKGVLAPILIGKPVQLPSATTLQPNPRAEIQKAEWLSQNSA